MSYACLTSSGRHYQDNHINIYSDFQQDLNNIIQSLAFRRLGYKTQVFINYLGDHYRTRLTHSIEVAQISRNICRRMQLNEDLGEVIALAHDLGHPPFGHSGEMALNELSEKYGVSFNHNAHTIKILTQLEQKYINYNGLNLTWEALEGIAKHNGPLDSNIPAHQKIIKLLQPFAERIKNINYASYPSLEAQVASLADDIAYCNHDMDDGIRSELFTIEDMQNIPEIWEIIEQLYQNYGTTKIPRAQLLSAFIMRLTKSMMEDLITNSLYNLQKYNIKDYQDVISCPVSLIQFSEQYIALNESIKQFLRKNMYYNHRLSRINYMQRTIIQKIFKILIRSPRCMPPEWFTKYEHHAIDAIVDYIAGMTDRYVINLYSELTGTTTSISP